MLLVVLLDLDLSARHWFATLIVDKLFVSLSAVSEQQIQIASSKKFELFANLSQEFVRSFKFFNIQVAIRHFSRSLSLCRVHRPEMAFFCEVQQHLISRDERCAQLARGRNENAVGGVGMHLEG